LNYANRVVPPIEKVRQMRGIDFAPLVTIDRKGCCLKEPIMNDQDTRRSYQLRPKEDEPELNPDVVDEASDESFPASDPPSWTPVRGVGAPKPQEKASIFHSGPSPRGE
jgi:hypothetical protein